MFSKTLEAQYPLDFRKQDAVVFGNHIRHRHSVNIIGMKRVGVGNFLRFFLSHTDAQATYIRDSEKHIFIPVDLNDLVEREIFPFWTLTLKRIVDYVSKSEIPSKQRRKIEQLFVKAIQLQDRFVAIDSVRQALVMLIEQGFLPTIFLLHFDRIKDAVSPSFFDNLEGMLTATENKLSIIFTSYRSLDELSPAVFAQTSLPFFSQDMFLGLAQLKDMEIILQTYSNRHNLTIPPVLKDALLDYVNGHVQYTHLSLLILQENEKNMPQNPQELFELLVHDERIILQSEELWESLADKEREALLAIAKEKTISERERKQATYLWDAGFVQNRQGKAYIFSPLFKTYLLQANTNHSSLTQSVHFSKKENALFLLLEQYLDTICERDKIIASVWPEYGEVGISDWAIDRLVARVRTKLRQQGSAYEIRTIRTRGYQLIKKE
jgi:DNA-binding winged helix-turn-helix (wHTH) protein